MVIFIRSGQPFYDRVLAVINSKTQLCFVMIIFHFSACPKTQSCNCCLKLMTISDLRGRSLPELYWPPITFNVKSISYINSHDPATLPLVKRSPQFILLGPLLPHRLLIDRSILTLISREEIIKTIDRHFI